MNSVHDSHRLPAWLATHFPVLPCQMVRVVKDQAGCLETDAVLPLVDLILSFIPGKFHGSLCIDEYV